jgi:hypothetical protein
MSAARWIAPAMIGAIAGVASSLITAHVERGDGAKGAQTGGQAQGASGAPAAPSPWLSAVSRAPAQAWFAPAQEGHPAPPARVSPAPARPQPTTEELFGRHQAALAAHARDPIDPQWAPRMEQRFSAALEPLAQSAGFEIVKTECRMSTCIAEARFKSYGSAVHAWGNLLSPTRPEGCTAKIVLGPPNEEGEPFEATALYDCAQAR